MVFCFGDRNPLELHVWCSNEACKLEFDVQLLRRGYDSFAIIASLIYMPNWPDNGSAAWYDTGSLGAKGTRGTKPVCRCVRARKLERAMVLHVHWGSMGSMRSLCMLTTRSQDLSYHRVSSESPYRRRVQEVRIVSDEEREVHRGLRLLDQAL